MSMLSELTKDLMIKAYEKKGYPLFTKGDYNLNIFGIRKNECTSNSFNDVLGLLYKLDGDWILKKYEATTDPGLYYRQNPMNKAGTAIIKEGYYKGAFKLGLHHGSYSALTQNKPLELYRDRNKDGVLNKEGTTSWEMAGINIHRATNVKGARSTAVNRWSAGCVVASGFDDFAQFMSIVKRSAEIYGPIFSFALFNELDVFGE